MKTKVTVLFTIVMALVVLGFKQDKKPWVVPDKYEKMANPSASAAATLKTGKELWVKHCQSCHGKTGKGDGPKAAQLKTEPGNFSTPATQKQSDGSLFYKTSEGRGDMPAFKKKIPDADDIWSIITFMRTLKS
jgi:mono/diheme cytochrome c family protein